MTQSAYSGSLSNDRQDDRSQSQNQSSSEIRADIDQTRASVGEKIDQIQARLDPSRLKAQAQETVQEMISDTASSMTDYVRSHKDEMVSTLADAARRNPLPAALIGLGVGWLILESFGGSKRRGEDDRWEYERRYLHPERSRFEGSTGRSFVSQGRGTFMEEDYNQGDFYNQYGSADYGRSGIPTAREYQGTAEYSPEYTQEYSSQEYGNGHRRGTNPLAKAAGAVKDTVSDVTHEIKDRVEDAGEEIKDRMGDVKDRVTGAVDDMRQQMSGTRDGMRHQMEGSMGGMRHQAREMSSEAQYQMQRAGYRMQEWQQQARYEGQRRGQQMMRNLEDNPLTYGAVALAAGVALALLLPRTRTENRAFGEMRDQLMERGGEMMETAKMRAQEVAQEIRPELEQTARNLVSEVKEAGKEVAQQAASEVRPVMDKAMERGKEEARSLAQDAGIDTEKMSGKSSGSSGSMSGSSTSASTQGTSTQSTGTATQGIVLNRDTLQGQWRQLKGEVKSKWGKLTDDDLTQIEGNFDKLMGKLQSRYGYTREQAEREINDFFKSHKV